MNRRQFVTLTAIGAGSAVLAQEPKLADFFALGKRVMVVWKGKVYRIEE